MNGVQYWKLWVFIEIYNEGVFFSTVHELENVVGCVVSQDQLKHVGNILLVIAVSQLETADLALIICTEEEIIVTSEDSARFSILIIFLSTDSE